MTKRTKNKQDQKEGVGSGQPCPGEDADSEDLRAKVTGWPRNDLLAVRCPPCLSVAQLWVPQTSLQVQNLWRQVSPAVCGEGQGTLDRYFRGVWSPAGLGCWIHIGLPLSPPHAQCLHCSPWPAPVCTPGGVALNNGFVWGNDTASLTSCKGQDPEQLLHR